jgi:rod shape-determining protein MreC
MNGFKVINRKHLIILALFTVLFWIVTVQVKNGRFPVLEKPVLAVSGFFERIIAWTTGAVESVGDGYAFLVRTHRENRKILAENERLRLENAVVDELLLENERFRNLLNFSSTQPWRTVAVRVIGKELSPASNTMTVNKGESSGIRKNMAVITPAGVVGKVLAVTSGTAKVILLTDPGSTLAVRVQRNREEGLLEGTLVKCALKYVSFYADIQKGDLLVTSGLDGVYPKGLAVATVSKIAKHEAIAFQSVAAEPVVRLSRLEEALVILQ